MPPERGLECRDRSVVVGVGTAFGLGDGQRVVVSCLASGIDSRLVEVAAERNPVQEQPRGLFASIRKVFGGQ